MNKNKNARVLIIREQDFGRIHSINYGMAIIATILSKQFNVKAIDNNSRYTSYSVNDFINVVHTFKPDVICFSIATVNAYSSYKTISATKTRFPDLPIVAGGLHVSHKFQEALDHKIDYVVRGEADMVIVPLISQIISNNDGNSKDNIDLGGVSFYRDNELISGGICPLPMDLDECSSIDYRLFNLTDYIKTRNDVNIFGGIITQRGCPFNCFFCSDIFIRTKVRFRSNDSILREIEQLYLSYGIDKISINDADFNVYDDRVVDFCNGIQNRGLHEKIEFVVQSDSFRLLKLSTLKAMRASGFSHMGIGLERMEKSTQKRINKKLNDIIVQENLRNLKELGFVIAVNYLTGFPFETIEKLQYENIAFKEILDKYVDIVSVGFLMPMPGTKEYENAKSINREWYLSPLLFPKYKPLYCSIRGIEHDPRTLNIFSLDKKILDEMMRTRDYFKAESIKKKNRLLWVVYRFSIVVAKISEVFYNICPKIEHFIFGRFQNLVDKIQYRLVRLWHFCRKR